IGIQTVDTAGNINPATMTDQATTRTIDRTPPASVTNLRETATGTNWIHWEWTNPNDADFGHVRIYIDGTFVTTTPSNSYNATGLSNGAEHTIAIETVDTSGNINTAQVSDTATTLKLPVISNVAGRNIRATSITLEWDASEDTATVQISVNGILLDTVTGPTYVHNGLNESTTYNYTLVPFNQNGLKGEAISISLATSSSSSGGGSSSKKSSSSSSSGGGGGAGSVEDFANVALKDVATRYLRMNANATYEFTREGNPIQSISFYSLKNSGEITSTIEVLNNRSKLVSMNPEGLLYKYVNIWVGKAGFATPANIEDAQVRFIVSNSWMEEMAISADDISLQRYNGSAWEILPTTLEGNNTGYSIFKAQTPGFSPFAITAGKKFAASIDGAGENSTIEDIALENTKTEKSRIWTYIMAFLLVGILVVGYEYMKRYKS
ncbi:MAG: PGF-pre-PGF domain-containing protein, partial [Methanomethylovorans sp.]|uniref:PGF-pre-PGF domain-containing protein n=1 Tax=Methanomethylovorans sp. TaxID=2758717 RepID=UPI003C774712